MSDPVLVALIAGGPGLITAIMSAVNSFKLNRLKKTADTTSSNVNERIDELLEKHGRVEYNRGKEDAKKHDLYT